MKNSILLLAVIFFATSCDWLVFDKDSSDSISGTTDIPMNTVGNTFSSSIKINGSYQNISGTIAITAVTDGVATVKFQFPIPSSLTFLQQIKPKYKDASGNLNCECKFKITDKGILDYNNIDHEPFVLVKYDAKVGDKYTLEKSDGKTIVREVVRKSTDDDFYWGGMIIKTVDVEQSSNIPGVEKIAYFTNHKFGIVAVRAYMEDGSTSQIDLSPQQY
ncbi:MAG: hypothetical protein A2W90_01170 [Bacteroidetes bacterium GWF2_42_66]|nr:MAG: hypothetical protein A2W92_00590 [Bacteroidetes bacterium GWA2_42_15]OFY00990.1 MAG: hypothetical protein A2W89_14660 [Bacteroidetes bacterium GWE2_42_39]OFY41830.1 MAG: hypothetical protein A2W90_01170 [Bacteroidetes bacterium GWF2_42_66]HBL77998.1 hypothetical protein [Prolixibacteraceae bacterium]HCR90239.1 hypothetical protein [Prolixibacteraceae bacterium]